MFQSEIKHKQMKWQQGNVIEARYLSNEYKILALCKLVVSCFYSLCRFPVLFSMGVFFLYILFVCVCLFIFDNCFFFGRKGRFDGKRGKA